MVTPTLIEDLRSSFLTVFQRFGEPSSNLVKSLIVGVHLRYPIFSYDDGTEVTASKPDDNGNIMLYIEKFDRQSDRFINATVMLPELSIVSVNGYDSKELDELIEEYSEVREDIVGYVIEKSA